MEKETYPLYNRSYEVVGRVPYVTEALVCFQGKYYMWYGEDESCTLWKPGYMEEPVFHWHGQEVAGPTEQVMAAMAADPIG